MNAFQKYVLSRLKEASTWRGLVMLATAAGLGISPAQADTIIQIGIALAGSIGVLFPDVK